MLFRSLSCLTAAVIAQACNTHPDFELACEAGLSAMRNLREEGHGTASEQANGFPASRLAKVIKTPQFNYSRARFYLSTVKYEIHWSLLWESSRSDQSTTTTTTTHEMARLVVQRGLVAL